MGFFETATGLGYLLGPMLGSVLYDIGGHNATFYGLCAINVILYPFMAWTANHVDALLKKAAQEEVGNQLELSNRNEISNYDIHVDTR